MKFLLALTTLIISTLLVGPAQARARAGLPESSAAILPQETPAPSPTPTPDPALEQATRDANLAEQLKNKAVSDQQRAEAETARLKALVQPFGAPNNISVPTGSVQTDAAGWAESQMLAQEAARQLTGQLTKFVCQDPKDAQGKRLSINKLVVYNANDLTGVEMYGAAMGQLERLRKELHEKNDEATRMLDQTDPTKVAVVASPGLLAAAAAPGIATGVIKSVAELINLFRTDTSFQNKAITVNEDMVVSYILKNLANNGFKLGDKTLVACSKRPVVYYPSLFPPLLTQLTSTTPSPLFQLLDDIEMEKVQAAANVTAVDARLKVLNDLAGKVEGLTAKRKELGKDTKDKADKEAALKKLKPNSAQAKKLRAEIKTLEDAIGKLNEDIGKLNDDLGVTVANANNFKDWIAKLTDLKVKTQGLITATELVTTKLNTPDESTKLTALAQLLRAERLHSILKDEDTYTLRVAVSANGTTKIKKNLFVDAKVRHAAGANLVYQLFNKDGVVAQGGALQCYIDYKSSQDVRDVASGLGSVECLFPPDVSVTGPRELAGPAYFIHD